MVVSSKALHRGDQMIISMPVVSAQQNTKTKRALIWFDWLFLAMIEKWSKRRLKKGVFIFVKSIVLPKNWFVVSNFWEFSKHHTEKQFSSHVFPTKN